MRVSYPELLSFAKKVLESYGLPLGIVEDGAEMVAWAAFAGWDGLKWLAAEQERLETGYPPVLLEESDQGAILHGEGISHLLIGRAAADLAYAKAIDQKRALVEVRNCPGSVCLAQNVYAIAQRGWACQVKWQEETGAFAAIMKPNMTFPLIGRAEPGDSASIWVECADPALVSLEELEFPLRTPLEMEGHWQAAREQGLEVEAGLWSQLSQIGNRVLVEATELSRRRGAGEEAND